MDEVRSEPGIGNSSAIECCVWLLPEGKPYFSFSTTMLLNTLNSSPFPLFMSTEFVFGAQ